MRSYCTDERYQITYSKRVTHAVKMVDSCSRENWVLCTVARSWLIFLHDERSGKILKKILLGVLMNRTKHIDLSSSLTASCVARFVICWVCRLYFSGLVCSVLSLDECLIKINYGRFCVCFRCLEKVILWSRLCLAMDEFRYHRWHVYLIFFSLEWMIYGGKLIWCDLLTSKIYKVEGTVLVSTK